MMKTNQPFEISPQAEAALPLIRELRRTLHRAPEPSACETATHGWIESVLRPLQPDVLETYAETGLKAVFYARRDGGRKALAFRADIDALRIQEQSEHEYASQNPGVMHACGHDGHTALALAAAHEAARMRVDGRLKRDVVFLFQPAEETIGGAERMCLEGALDDPEIEAIFGFHLMPDLPTGRVAIRSGPLMASTHEADILLTGKPAHGALPHKGADAVAAAAHLITTLPQVLARRLDPTELRLVTFGRLEAGTQRNVLAAAARMEGIVRTFSDATDQAVFACLRACCAELEPLYGVTCEIKDQAYYPAVINPPELFERVRAMLGGTAVEAKIAMTAEDFSFFQRRVPGMFMFLGCGGDAYPYPLHHACFDFDERALLPGLELILRLWDME